MGGKLADMVSRCASGLLATANCCTLRALSVSSAVESQSQLARAVCVWVHECVRVCVSVSRAKAITSVSWMAPASASAASASASSVSLRRHRDVNAPPRSRARRKLVTPFRVGANQKTCRCCRNCYR